jgi:hypothetical protein
MKLERPTELMELSYNVKRSFLWVPITQTPHKIQEKGNTVQRTYQKKTQSEQEANCQAEFFPIDY